jgi:hypothetical protein
MEEAKENGGGRDRDMIKQKRRRLKRIRNGGS